MTINYTITNHVARIALDLSMNEYAVADLTYHLSNNPKSSIPGWCYASKETMGKMLGLSKQSIHNILNTLLKKEIITKNEETAYFKASELWYQTVIIKQREESLPSVKKVYSDSKESLLGDSKESLHYNDNTNNDIYNDKEQVVVALLPIKKEILYKLLEDVGETQFQQIAEHYQVPLSFVLSKYEDMVLWAGQQPNSGKLKGRNWKLTLMNWVKRDAQKIMERRVQNNVRPSIDARGLSNKV